MNRVMSQIRWIARNHLTTTTFGGQKGQRRNQIGTTFDGMAISKNATNSRLPRTVFGSSNGHYTQANGFHRRVTNGVFCPKPAFYR